MKELLPRLQDKNDEIAWGELLERTQPLARVQATAVLGFVDANTVDDVASETVMRVRRDLAKLQDPSAFFSWVRGICRNVCLERARGTRKEEPLSPVELPDCRTRDPVEELISKELRQIVDNCMSQLEEKYRTLLLRYYAEGLSQADIGTQMGLTENNVKQRLFRARALVRDCVARKGGYHNHLLDEAPSSEGQQHS